MPRFVVLEHNHPKLHWDFMLESGMTLKTWKLHAPPVCGSIMPVEMAADHRLAYLEYEGPISGNRGSVVRWDSGTFEWLSQSVEEFKVEMSGQKLQGIAKISLASLEQWQLDLNEANRLAVGKSAMGKSKI